MSIVGLPNIGNGWIITPGYAEGNYRHYEILTASTFNINIAANTETPVMELEFSGGPVSYNDVSLVTLPMGGASTGNALFYCTGAIFSEEGQLYYTRPGTTVINNMSYTGILPSSATVGGILLPLNWLSFTAVKQGNNALLNWAVANEDDNHHYELQRSNNGTDFTVIATINKSVNGNTNYSYTDVGIHNSGATILYYRVKQVDFDGKTSFSDTRFITLDKKTGPVTVFPNPASDGFYVKIPFEKPDSRMVQLNLIGLNGQVVCTKQITTTQAANYYFNLKDRLLAAGDYYLNIIFEEKTMETKKIIIIR
jgi:hypothetical protein